jgi:phospholipid/cholesterol/gamma-HCH transport system substrate-binding protein
MARQLDWKRLVPGLIALAAVVGSALSILLFARVGALHGKTTRLYIATSAARGVIPGTDVWLEGQRVGIVKKIRFQAPTTPIESRLVIEVDILRSYLKQLRSDSYAQIRSAGSLIGSPVVYLSIGSGTGSPLANRDTIQAKPQGDFEGVTSQIALASRHFPAIIANVKTLHAELGTARGTLGAAMAKDGTEQLTILMGNASQIGRRAFESGGSLSLTFRDGDLMGRASRAIAMADSIQTLLDLPTTSFGRFQRDTSLKTTIADLRNEVSIVRALMANAEGTAGRVTGDSAVFQQLTRLQKDLGSLMDDIKRHPLRYIAF